MTDREKIIRDIERCAHHVPDACRDCSKYGGGYELRCMEHLMEDALALLREQEPVEPIKTPETIRAEYNCGKCTAPIGIMFHDGDWYYKADYCPRCGRKVAWS